MNAKCATIAMLAAASLTTPAKAESPLVPIRLVLELQDDDSLLIDPRTIIASCTNEIQKGGLRQHELAALRERRGNSYLQIKDFEKARKDFEAVLAIRPKDISARWRVAKVLSYLGRTADAMASLEEIVKSDPEFSKAYCSIAVIHLLNKDHGKSVSAASKAIAITKNEAWPFYVRACALFREKRYEEALRDIDEFLAIQPQGFGSEPEDFYAFRGDVLVGLRKREAALNSYLMAYRLNPKSSQICYRLWQSYQWNGKPNLSLRMAEEMLRAAPQSAEAYNCCACSYIQTGQIGKAKDAAKKSIELDPKDPDGFWRLGGAHFVNGEYGDALSLLRRALAIDPAHRGATLASASILASCPDDKLRDGVKARALLESVVKENPDDPAVLGVLAQVQAECGEYDKAVKTCERALELGGLRWQMAEQYSLCKELFRNKKPFRFSRENVIYP